MSCACNFACASVCVGNYALCAFNLACVCTCLCVCAHAHSITHCSPKHRTGTESRSKAIYFERIVSRVAFTHCSLAHRHRKGLEGQG